MCGADREYRAAGVLDGKGSGSMGVRVTLYRPELVNAARRAWYSLSCSKVERVTYVDGDRAGRALLRDLGDSPEGVRGAA